MTTHITDAQIERFQAEAAEHGDIAGAAIAAKALGIDYCEFCHAASIKELASAAVDAMTVQQCRAQVEEWINSAIAQGDGNEYRIAFATADGEWDVVETFIAYDDTIANAYADANYSGDEWYVLDASGRNINGGDQT